MNARDRILSKVRAATDPLPEKTALPDLDVVASIGSRTMPDAGDANAVCATFEEEWTKVGGILVNDESELIELLKSLDAGKGYADPALALESLKGAFEVDDIFDREQVDTYSFSITRATGAVGETGTIILTDGDTPNRLSALAPWIHVAVLSRENIEATLGAAIPTFGSDPSVVLVTGPSKTADIEGILIEGVHGPGVQICLLV